jgi:hypothetical protein
MGAFGFPPFLILGLFIPPKRADEDSPVTCPRLIQGSRTPYKGMLLARLLPPISCAFISSLSPYTDDFVTSYRYRLLLNGAA